MKLIFLSSALFGLSQGDLLDGLSNWYIELKGGG